MSIITSNEPHVFLSYCRENQVQVSNLRDAIIAAGIKVWWDQDILPGQNWENEIHKALSDSYAFIVCFSKEMEKRYKSGVYEELRQAISISRKRPPDSIYLIPVRLNECKLPEFTIDDTTKLFNLQYVDLFPGTFLSSGVEKLIKTFTRTLKNKGIDSPESLDNITIIKLKEVFKSLKESCDEAYTILDDPKAFVSNFDTLFKLPYLQDNFKSLLDEWLDLEPTGSSSDAHKAYEELYEEYKSSQRQLTPEFRESAKYDIKEWHNYFLNRFLNKTSLIPISWSENVVKS